MITVPNLIQRGTVASNLRPANVRLSEAVDFDYMGSAEFEFGALPKSFRRIEANADSFVMRKVPEITKGTADLRVWSYLSDEEFEEYKTYLIRLRYPTPKTEIRTKETTRFNADYHAYNPIFETNFWWDVDNDVMFGFKKNFMNRVGDYVASSLKYMNEEKAKRAAK